MNATPLGQKIDNVICGLEQIGIQIKFRDAARILLDRWVAELEKDLILVSLLERLHSKHPSIWIHSLSVGAIAGLMAQAMGHSQSKTLDVFGLGGILHDIGYLQFTPETLQKTGQLSLSEWNLIKSHPRLGLQLVHSSTMLSDDIRRVIYQHHEELSGSGYPIGLSGQDVEIPSKVVSVADAFEALISDRPYRRAYSVEQAIQVLQSQTGKYDRELTQVLLTLHPNIAF